MYRINKIIILTLKRFVCLAYVLLFAICVVQEMGKSEKIRSLEYEVSTLRMKLSKMKRKSRKLKKKLTAMKEREDCTKPSWRSYLKGLPSELSFLLEGPDVTVSFEKPQSWDEIEMCYTPLLWDFMPIDRSLLPRVDATCVEIPWNENWHRIRGDRCGPPSTYSWAMVPNGSNESPDVASH